MSKYPDILEVYAFASRSGSRKNAYVSVTKPLIELEFMTPDPCMTLYWMFESATDQLTSIMGRNPKVYYKVTALEHFKGYGWVKIGGKVWDLWKRRNDMSKPPSILQFDAYTVGLERNVQASKRISIVAIDLWALSYHNLFGGIFNELCRDISGMTEGSPKIYFSISALRWDPRCWEFVKDGVERRIWY